MLYRKRDEDKKAHEQGVVPRFQEAFLGEGNYKPLKVMRALKRVGFTGFILDDHVPRMTGDTEYAHRGRAHAIGYLQALLAAVEDEAPQETPAGQRGRDN